MFAGRNSRCLATNGPVSDFIISQMATEYQNVGTPSVQQRQSARQATKWEKFKHHAIGAPGVIVGALLGVAFGIILQQAKANDTVISWIALPGDLFIRALKCLVAPLVFCSLITGMADMLKVGKASSIGWRAAALYTFTTVVAAIEGLIWVVIFRPMFAEKDGDEKKQDDFEKLTLSESLQAQLKQMVPSNITSSFADGNLLSIVMFALPFGIAVATLPLARDGSNRLLDFFRLMNQVFMRMVRWAIAITPIAVFFLIAGSLAGQQDLTIFEDMGVLILTVFVGLLLHTLVFLPTFLALVIKSNPFQYLKHVVPAQVFALGCASSMATLPVTMKCVEATRQVSSSLSRFVLSLGATINMDGSALYYPAAIVFMAETAGYGDQVGAVQMFLIIIVATIGAVGSAPVPSAGIVMTVTIWNSVFPNIPLPRTFSYIVATDWLLDRLITATNVTGDTVIARVIAELVDERTLEEARESMNSTYEEFAEHNDQGNINNIKSP